METKVCACCGKEKSTVLFSKNRSEPDGLQHTCKECQALRNASKKATGEDVKVCPMCGEEKPVSQYAKNASKSDGLNSYCKVCHTKSTLDSRRSKSATLHKIYTDKTLAAFTPRQLIAELKARGYTGELKIVQTVKL